MHPFEIVVYVKAPLPCTSNMPPATQFFVFIIPALAAPPLEPYATPSRYALTSVMKGCPCITKVQEDHFKVDIDIKKELLEKTLGQRLRKARLDEGLSLKEVVS